MNARLAKKITEQKAKIEQFIDSIHAVLSSTPDENERNNRLEVFDTLLLLATYADLETLEIEFTNSLPNIDSDKTLNYLRQQLREINGLCKKTLSDDHEVYHDLFSLMTLPTPEKKQALRELLSNNLSQVIFDKTNTVTQTLMTSLQF
ncbi:MAG: hypothetical protein ACRCXC_04795 [Legionella sp.]